MVRGHGHYGQLIIDGCTTMYTQSTYFTFPVYLMGCSLLLFTLHPPQSLGPVAGLLTLTCSPFRCRSHLETHMGFGIGVATSVSFRVSVLGRLSAWDRLRLPTVSAGSGISAEKLVSKALVLVHSSLLTPHSCGVGCSSNCGLAS